MHAPEMQTACRRVSDPARSIIVKSAEGLCAVTDRADNAVSVDPSVPVLYVVQN